MKRLVAFPFAVVMAAVALAAPALANPEKKTELVDDALDGSQVDKMRLRDDFDAVWVVDTQRVLYRDDRRAYYLVTLDAACPSLGIRSKEFRFPPWMVVAASDELLVRDPPGRRVALRCLQDREDRRSQG